MTTSAAQRSETATHHVDWFSENCFLFGNLQGVFGEYILFPGDIKQYLATTWRGVQKVIFEPREEVPVCNTPFVRKQQ